MILLFSAHLTSFQGAVAQLGERIPRTDEAVGSTPICSTIRKARVSAAHKETRAFCRFALCYPELPLHEYYSGDIAGTESQRYCRQTSKTTVALLFFRAFSPSAFILALRDNNQTQSCFANCLF
jgi:hypothetical protein